MQQADTTGTYPCPGEDRSMKQFRVIFTRTLTHEEVIEAASLEAVRKRADEREQELTSDDFATSTTTYDIQEVDGD
jgi:hypothetical protein